MNNILKKINTIMAGYEDTRQKIISTLMGRPNGTEIQPENHQDYALNMLDYIRSLELIATSTLIGVAESNTTPVQPNGSRVCYIAGVDQNQTVTFENFIGQDGNPISVTTGDMEGVFVILMWNTQYWSAQTFSTNIISHSESATFYYRYNIRKTYESVALMNADVVSPIGTDGKYIKVGDIVTVVNSITPSENGFYSYEGAVDGWKYQSSFNFQLSQDFGNDPNQGISQKFYSENILIDNYWYDDSTHSTSEYFKIKTYGGLKYKSYGSSPFFRVVFLDKNNNILPQSVTGFNPDITYYEIETPINVNEIFYIRFQRLTGSGTRVILCNFAANIATNTANIETNTANIQKIKSSKSVNKTFVNLMPNVNSQQVLEAFSSNSTFLNPGYRLSSSVVNSFARATNSFNYIEGHRVALLAKIRFDSVTDDFRFQFGFHASHALGWDISSVDYDASSFGLTNLTGTTQVFALKWDATKASTPLFFIYKAEVASGQTETYTILDFAVIDMGVNSENELYNKTNSELSRIFENCTVFNEDIFYEDLIVKKAEEAMTITPDLVLKINKNYGKKLVTIGDSLTANLIWQPKLQSFTGLQWSALETGTGVGYVNTITGEYTTDDKSSDPNYRHAYKMAIGGTIIRPNSTDSIFIRSFDAVHYNPEIVFVYGGQNDILSGWKTAGNLGTTTDEIVKNEIAYKTNAIDDSISVIAAYKGMIENLMSLCPNAIIYLVTQMRVLGRVGMLDAGGNIRFPTIQSVIDWEMTERYPKVEYIRAIGKLYGLPVIDLWNDSGITDYNAESWYGEPATDCTQVHPDTIGYYRMAEVMEKYL